MKKQLQRCIALLLALLLLPVVKADAVYYADMTWQSLNAASTFDEPYADYDSVFDRTQEKYLFDDMEADLLALAAAYPAQMRLETIGYSELGRPIYAVVIGSDTAKNRMFIIAEAHAREYATSQLAVLQIEYYLHNYANTINGEPLSDLFDRCQFYFIPMLNPDGAMISMKGLASLDDPRLTASAETIEAVRSLMLAEVDEMNATCEASVSYHDTDAYLYSADPDPTREDAFQYWKANAKGVDLHYNMYSEWMYNRWDATMGEWFDADTDDHFTAPGWQNYAGSAAGDGVNLAAENVALANYLSTVRPNLFITYHTASNFVQWNYGYSAGVKKNVAKQISYTAADLLGFAPSDTRNPYIGHAGWFMKNSESYMNNSGYGVTFEFASRNYLASVGGRSNSYVDAPPTQIIQLTQDVVTASGQDRPPPASARSR